MVRLRLRRKGKKHHPTYDIVAVDSRKRRDGAFLERLGYYDPHTKPSTISMNTDRAIYWLGVGAQPSVLVNKLLSFEGILLRKQLLSIGKTEEEILTAIEEHKKIAKARYYRRKELRKKREKAKKEKEAEKTEE